MTHKLCAQSRKRFNVKCLACENDLSEKYTKTKTVSREKIVIINNNQKYEFFKSKKLTSFHKINLKRYVLFTQKKKCANLWVVRKGGIFVKRRLQKVILALAMCVSLVLPSADAQAATTLYNNATGTQDGYNYELWKDYGTTSMTLNGGGAFDCSWSNIGNALFRTGKKFDCTQTYQQIGNISIDYGVNYQPNGNSYLCVYGWTRDPLVEYYIVESWGTWRPPGATSKGTITVDGGTYDVYETTRVNQPSIDGDTTFQQYWSVRTSKRTSGTISVTEHFKAWERMGMKMGKLYEAALNVEGYQSSGSASVYKNNIIVGGSSSGSSGSGSGGSTSGSVSTGNSKECESMTITGQYAGKISSPFNGVALYANNESVSYTQYFEGSTHDFTLRGASNGDSMAKVDLVIGGETKGTFYYGDSNVAEYTIENVTHGTGNQKIELVVTTDDGKWDAYLDCLTISGSGSGAGSSNSGSTTGGNTTGGNTSGGNTSGGAVSTGSSKECEAMTVTGQYAGTISSPFNGVALYANNESVSYTQYFEGSTHDFTLRGASNGDNMAKVDLVIGGETKGTFYYGDSNTAEYTIPNVSHGTGNQEIKLVVTTDDGKWDAFVDCLIISAAGTAGAGTAGGNTSGGNTSGNTPSGKLVALTFDDGPSSTTNDVLDVLEKYDVKATFFLIGNQIDMDTLSIMQRQVNMGCELANHSYTHQDMSNMSATDVKNQIEWTSSAIKNAVGADVKFFRPPYLATSNTMYQNIDLAFIQGINTQDYDSAVSASQRVSNVLNNVTDGSIVLLHDFQGNTATVQALPTIIEKLKNQGYSFVTLSELFEAKGVNPNQEYKIWTNALK